MSYFKLTCAGCGVRYFTGVVGPYMIGGHRCRWPWQRRKRRRLEAARAKTLFGIES